MFIVGMRVPMKAWQCGTPIPDAVQALPFRRPPALFATP
ncbi:hypothetical protein U91I_00082 [alpha proteobacterium U9-1i]|nr:hypothetical protein U91I_00082 [alpha proteobacterium U9-1i]